MAENDINVKKNQVEKYLNKEYKIEITLFMKGREKLNKEWALEKLKNFLEKINLQYKIINPIKETGKGFTVQIEKKK